MRLPLLLLVAALVLIAAILPWLGFVNAALALLAAALALIVLLPLLGLRTVGFLGRTDTARFRPGQFNHQFDASTPLPAGVIGVTGATTGALVDDERGEVQVGFGAENAVDLGGVAEVGQTFRSTGRNQLVTATLFVQFDYSYDLPAGSRGAIDIEVFVVPTGLAGSIRYKILSLAPTGPDAKSDQSNNPAFDPANPPPAPLDERTIGIDIAFTKRRNTNYTIGLAVRGRLVGTGLIQVKAVLKEIQLERRIL